MSIIEISEELVSEVDINAEMTEKGLLLSIYVDDQEFNAATDWRDIGLEIAGDTLTYPNPVAKAIAKQMRIVSDYILGEVASGRE